MTKTTTQESNIYLRNILYQLEGNKEVFIVDAANALVAGENEYYDTLVVVEDVTGFTCTELAEGGTMPTAMAAGIEVYGRFTNVSVTTGVVRAYKKSKRYL